MKIKKLMKQTKEYERLERIIKGIEKALEDFDKIKKGDAEGGWTVLRGDMIRVTLDGVEEEKRSIDVTLNREISALIRSDVKDLLLGHLGIMKKQQNDLEI